MEKKNKEKKGLKLYALGAIMILALFSLSGCVAQGESGAQNSAIIEKPSIPAEPVRIDDAGNKNGYEQIQEEVTLAIADGTYVDEVSYDYHSGTETMEVSITVAGDIVKEASIIPVGDVHPYSLKLINDVNSELPNLVVGKKITELNIPANVAGSSLTTAAFKLHVEQLVEKY